MHVVEGEGGLTPGRVAEALAAAGTGGSTTSSSTWTGTRPRSTRDHVCREGERPGDYVQWTRPSCSTSTTGTSCYVPDGMDFQQVIEAQRLAARLATGQPTAIVYRTVKGWRYGIEGRASHGAGHKFCSEGFYAALAELVASGGGLPHCERGTRRCEVRPAARPTAGAVLLGGARIVREHLEEAPGLAAVLPAGCWRRANASTAAADARARHPASTPPTSSSGPRARPAGFAADARRRHHAAGRAGARAWHLNRASGAFLVAAADLAGSTT